MLNPTQDRPIPFILLNQKGQFEITPEAKEFLLTLTDQPLAIISVVGKYRTGKSYFINKALLNQNRRGGFKVGPTINPCTKGIWLWTGLRDCGEFGGESGQKALILDTEGFGGVDEDVNHDSRIFLFSLLLSSFFIFNSLGQIDENALQSIDLILGLAQKIKLGEGGQKEEEVAKNFPKFLWVIRDFMLKLEKRDGTPLTSKEYLEQSLLL